MTLLCRLLNVTFIALALTPCISWGYYGRLSQEAILTYQTQIEVPKSYSKAALKVAIDEQIQHLMGTFQSISFQDEFGFPGVLGEDHAVKITSVSAGRSTNRKIYTYQFKGKVVFQKTAFHGGKSRSVPLKLPLAPDEIYSLGMVGSENLCTDEHYNSEGDFWYFWDPDQRGCPLKGNTEDVLRFKGTLKPLANTELTYPEYDRFYGDNGNGNLTEFFVFLGYINDIDHINRPHRSDAGFETLQYVAQNLEGLDFNLTEKIDAFRLNKNHQVIKGANFYRVYEKEKVIDGEKKNIRIKILLADTAIESTDATFHQYLKEAFEKSDAVIYDGHSGLGGNLDIAQLPKIKFDPKKYQIYYFNGCSSYPYYNGMFSEAKGGTKSVDILTAGLETSTATSGTNVMAFLNRFISGSKVSYQKILSEMEKSNLYEGTYLLGVNGDEDNRFKPKN